jgi:MoaD family protein
MITIHVSGFLTDFTGGERTIVLDGSPPTVEQALQQLWTRHVGLRDRVVNERGQVRPHVGVFVNADHIRHREELATALRDGDEITILPAISGGRLSRR